MRRLAAAALTLISTLAAFPAAQAAGFSAGHDYFLLSPPQNTSVPAGKVEVMEVFSYGCPACNTFQPAMQKLRASLPANAQLVLLPAAFNKAEDWPMFQRSYFAAQILGVAERTHQAMFDAVWKTRELATTDGSALKDPQPSLEQAAAWYEKHSGVKAAEFLATARSFSVDMKMKAADAQILAMEVPGTPCIVVNGKYRLNMDGLTTEGLLGVVKFLIDKESAHAP
jgi:thiol:disulfide interchange protein DsbA